MPARQDLLGVTWARLSDHELITVWVRFSVQEHVTLKAPEMTAEFGVEMKAMGQPAKSSLTVGGVTRKAKDDKEEEGEMVAEPGCTTLKSAGIFTQRRRNE